MVVVHLRLQLFSQEAKLPNCIRRRAAAAAGKQLTTSSSHMSNNKQKKPNSLVSFAALALHLMAKTTATKTVGRTVCINSTEIYINGQTETFLFASFCLLFTRPVIPTCCAHGRDCWKLELFHVKRTHTHNFFFSSSSRIRRRNTTMHRAY